ncbi:hypothetical protein H310_00351 [Aphanomyces invadans]|uniref:BED-type domain-containing protein n=1 Tax=Aphanomyces invadans TaxID=157072 RepID=A0A024UVJ1_9STRA|nr:hypothetical protein H310_00351 [Aphanomyces invadans]ETW09922.1 hypothetical protein H310_00351 [Aphanomyces invadans]|eukprot:XP_008861333.1 hypothetical protein H310_00351 [Aphanomyces invadans]
MESSNDGRSGPRSDPIWDHFTRGDRHGISRVRAAKCNYCIRQWKYADLSQMKSHIATDCPGDVPVKLRSLGIVADGLGPPIKRRKREKDGEDGSKSNLDGSGGVISPLGLSSAIMMHHRDALKQGMLHNSKGKGGSGGIGQSDPLEKILMVKAFVCNDIPIEIADNKHFREWLKGINSSYKSVSGDDLRTLVLHQYSAEMTKLKDVVANGFHRITLTPSGRRDASNQRIVHINLTNQTRVSIIWNIVSFQNEEESLQRLGSQVLTPVLMEVSPERFIGVCTGDDPDLLQAAEEVATTYPWILPIRCMAQLTNYLLREWMKIPDINHVFMVAGSILSYFRQSPDATLMLQDMAAQMNVHRCRLLQFSATSLSDCILSLYSIHLNESVIKPTIVQAFRTNCPFMPSPQLVNYTSRPDFWNNLRSLLVLFRPIKTLFDLFQTCDVSIADCYAGFVSLNALLLNLCSNASPSPNKLSTKLFAQMTPPINEIWGVLDKVGDGLYLLAYFCHPRYHKRGLHRHYFPNILRTALTIWMKRRKTEAQARNLRQGLHDLWAGEGMYNVSTFLTTGVEPRSWVSVLPNADLVELCLLLLEVQPLSAEHAKYNRWPATDGTSILTGATAPPVSSEYTDTCTRLKSIYEARDALSHDATSAGQRVSDVVPNLDNLGSQCDSLADAETSSTSTASSACLDETKLLAHLGALAKDWSMTPADEYDPSANLNLIASFLFDLNNTDLHNIWRTTVTTDTPLVPSMPVGGSGQEQGFNIDELVSEYTM